MLWFINLILLKLLKLYIYFIKISVTYIIFFLLYLKKKRNIADKKGNHNLWNWSLTLTITVLEAEFHIKIISGGWQELAARWRPVEVQIRWLRLQALGTLYGFLALDFLLLCFQIRYVFWFYLGIITS